MTGSHVMDLEDLAATARSSGWAVGFMPLWLLRSSARELGWQELPTRKGDGPVSTLRPTRAITAHPRSLSATHGLEEQPLHTDGAHLPEPPDLVVLHAAHPSPTPTLLWSELSRLTNTNHPQIRRLGFLVGGVFIVRGGSERFLASAYADGAGYRFDPGCMTAADQRAHEVVQHFNSLAETAYRHEWIAPDRVLVINNRRTLHARAAIAPGDGCRELIRIAYRAGVAR